MIIQTHSPYNSPVWPVQKPNGNWQLTIDYRCLNANTGPLTVAVPNIAELISTVQEQAHPILATIDMKDMFFMVPLQENDQNRFAFTREGPKSIAKATHSWRINTDQTGKYRKGKHLTSKKYLINYISTMM